jgi:peroxiredoxin
MKQLFVTISILCTIAAYAADYNPNYKIQGKMAGLKEGTIVFLSAADGNAIATTTAKSGSFVLEGYIEAAAPATIGFIGYSPIIELYLEASKNIQVNGQAVNITAAKVTGSVLQTDFALFQQRFTPLKNKLNNIVPIINQTPQGFKRDSLIMQYQLTLSGLQREIDRFVAEKPQSPVTAYVLAITVGLSDDPTMLEKRMVGLSETALDNEYGRYLTQKLNEGKVGAIGTQAADFTQNDAEGRPISLSFFRGKYVLVDFWASWCRPCREENPNVVAAYQSYKNKNFTVLGVSFDNNKDLWLKAVEKDQLNWPQVSDLQGWGNAVGKIYGIRSIPQNLLIDPTGKIIAKNLRGEALQQKLAEILQ